jgi:hypothetical protein
LGLSANAARAPDGNGDSIVTVINRLNAIANDLAEEMKDQPGELRSALMRQREDDVRAAVDGIRALSALIGTKIPRYEEKFEEAATQRLPLEH